MGSKSSTLRNNSSSSLDCTERELKIKLTAAEKDVKMAWEKKDFNSLNDSFSSLEKLEKELEYTVIAEDSEKKTSDLLKSLKSQSINPEMNV